MCIRDRLNDGNHSVLEFETTIDDISVNGVDMIEWDDDGKLSLIHI